ncbi:MAG: FadR family transcriptional regulator [Chloroflexota bacterium]|nr:FadR family transcriptional regulator [Chloroflexota bacterium]
MRSDTQHPPRLPRIDRTRVKDLALDELKRYIASGAVAPGHRLPSERDLAQQLGIGRNSVREAIKVLEAIGIVESRIGEGTYISDQAGASMGRAIGLSLATWGGALIEILRARQMIETEAAGVAALQATEGDLASIQEYIDLMAQHADSGDVHAYIAMDMSFHRRVAASTHNTIIGEIVTNLIDLLEEVLRDAHVDQLEPMVEGGASHRDIAEAIVRRDPRAASDAMRDHLQFSTELWAAVTSLSQEL